MNGEDFAFIEWVIREEQEWEKFFGSGWPWTHLANDTYLWRWRYAAKKGERA